MFCLSNLILSDIRRCEPWKFRGEVPNDVRNDKRARTLWINNSRTKWQCCSLVEGLHEGLRVNKGKDEENGNPPHALHGFIGDYDHPITDQDLATALKDFPYPPQYVERTLSGNLRLIWLFESPLLVPSDKFLRFFLERVLAEFGPDKLLPAFDKAAWCEPTRYYTNSGEWKEMPGKPIPRERVLGWMVNIGRKFEWTKESGSVEIPLETLRDALAKKYPRFYEWPGEFSLRAQGPSFWIDNSTSPSSAIVHETGIYTFSAHATKGFHTWADLLGHQFVKGFQSDNMGRAVEGIYHDGLGYWCKLPTGSWRCFDKGDTREYLRISRQISVKGPGGISDIDRANAAY